MTHYADLDRIENHIGKHVGKIDSALHEIISDDLHIDVAHVKSTWLRRYEVLITMGMSALPMNIPADAAGFSRLELCIVLPKHWPLSSDAFRSEVNYWPVRLLKDLARFVHHHHTWFGFGHTVAHQPDGDTIAPYADNTALCASVLLPSITLGESFYLLEAPEEQDSIGFMSVIPLHQDELELKMTEGIDPLLDLFDQHKITDYVDPKRPSVINRH